MADYTSYTDDQLLALLKLDDEAAFAVLYKRYWKPLYAVAYPRVNSVPDTEEAVQNIFIRLWNRRKELQLQYSLSTYLSAAVQYEVIAIRARRDKRAEHEQTAAAKDILFKDVEPSQNTMQEQLDADDLLERMHRTLHTLPVKSRLIFLKNRQEHKTYKTIARELNVSEKTVEKHMTRTLARLRTALISIFLTIL